MLPVWNHTEAPCSSGPGLTGSTLTAISFADPAGIVPSDQVSTRRLPRPLAGGLAGDEFQSLGQLVADADLQGVGGAGVADHQADGRRLVQVHARRRLDVDRDRDRLLAGGEPIDRGRSPRSGPPAAVAGPSVRSIDGSRAAAAGVVPDECRRASPARRRIGEKAGTTPAAGRQGEVGRITVLVAIDCTPAFAVGPVFRLSAFV